MKRALIAAVLLVCPTLAAAQTNWRVEFAASPDHARVENQVPVLARYELAVAPQPSGTATVIDLGKPTPAQTTNLITVPLPTLTSLPVGTYIATVKAIGPGGETTAVSDPFLLRPLAPQAPASKPILGRATSGSHE